MNMFKGILLVAGLAAVAAAGCATKAAAPLSTAAPAVAAAPGQGPVDHLALARQYQQDAADAEAKVKQYTAVREGYRTHGYLYGKDIFEVEESANALIDRYANIADTSRKLAAMHMKMAGAKSPSP
jgi:hypothetical protein